jgi:hypothetical protein
MNKPIISSMISFSSIYLNEKLLISKISLNKLSDSDDEQRMEVLEFHGPGEGRIKEVRVRPGSLLSFGKLILIYQVLGISEGSLVQVFRIRKYFCGSVNLNSDQMRINRGHFCGCLTFFF